MQIVSSSASGLNKSAGKAARLLELELSRINCVALSLGFSWLKK